ncbi:MAG: cytochrome c oxidase subunit II [Planctomycetes bacterium]|nr:cytochrome c oxidase subunit II [Planctomycetota bacterium]
MLRLLFFICLLALAVCAVPSLGAADPVKPPVAPVVSAPLAVDPVDRDVELFNPNVYSLDESGHGPKHVTRSPFTDPASDIAREVASVTWLSSLIFLPFLVLPLLLLLYVIFKFRDTGDGRKPATFTGNHTLEIVWTVIPCVALVLVSIPTWFILDKMEAPPEKQKDRMAVRVTGKKFAWDYKYLGIYKDPKAEEKQEIAVGQFLGIQEPLVLAKGRTVELHMTSDDVNHAWWIPPFGVKKDCIKGRDTYAWFTPDTIGFFKGQCAELCGDGHGLMIITSAVVEKPDFERWLALQRMKDDTFKVWTTIQPPAGTAIDDQALREVVTGFLAKGRSPERQYALRYWIACNYATLQRVPPPTGVSLAEVFGAAKGGGATEIAAAIRVRRAKVDVLLQGLVADLGPATESTIAGSSTAAIAVPGAQP